MEDEQDSQAPAPDPELDGIAWSLPPGISKQQALVLARAQVIEFACAFEAAAKLKRKKRAQQRRRKAASAAQPASTAKAATASAPTVQGESVNSTLHPMVAPR